MQEFDQDVPWIDWVMETDTGSKPYIAPIASPVIFWCSKKSRLLKSSVLFVFFTRGDLMRSRYQSPHHEALNSRRPCLLFREWVPIVLAMALLITLPSQANAQSKEAITPFPAEEKFEGKIVAKELSPEIKLAIDAMRQLRETPGLIMDRSAIYKILDAQPVSVRVFKTSYGSRHMNEVLKSSNQNESEDWEIEIFYTEHPKIKSWVAAVKIDLNKSKKCYTSRLVEAYWGQVFVYVPWGVHALLSDLSEQVAGRSTGPHDGIPYSAQFLTSHPDTANVSFTLDGGSCLSRFSASKLLKFEGYSDDRFYHEQ